MNWNNARAIPTVAVTDLNEGKRFYGQTLGLEDVGTPAADEMKHTYFRCGDSYLCLYERPEPANSAATVFALQVDDVQGAVEGLRQKGVEFQDFDIPEMGLKTKNGIATMNELQSAWFTDPWGNTLAIDNGLGVLAKAGTQTAQIR